MPGYIFRTYFGCVRLDDHIFTSSTRTSPVNGNTKPLLASPICLIKITQNAKTMLKNHRYLNKRTFVNDAFVNRTTQQSISTLEIIKWRLLSGGRFCSDLRRRSWNNPLQMQSDLSVI